MRALALLALAVLIPFSSAGAAPADERASVKKALAAEKAEADALATARANAQQALTTIQQKAATGAKKLQAAEETLTRLEGELAALQNEIAVGEATLAEDEAALNQTLAALLRLSRRPPETAILEPGSVVDRLRTARLLGDLGRQVDEKAAKLRTQLAALEVLYGKTEAAKIAAAEATTTLQARQQEMAALLKERQVKIKELDSGLAERQRQIKALTAKAKSLDAVLAALALQQAAGLPHPRPKGEKLTAQTRTPPAKLTYTPRPSGSGQPFSKQKGRLMLPVRGPVVARFGGQSADFLTGLRGLMVESRPNAQVTIPADGEILYSGPFRSYGGLLIIDVGNGYHMLLAGLERIDAEVGQRLLAGEPVGLMGTEGASMSHKSPNSAQLSATDGAGLVKTGAGKLGARRSGGDSPQQNFKPRLYFELRKAGKPVDPWVWLAPSEKKERG